MEIKYKKFKKYNWAYSDEWKHYYDNLYPSPPISKLLHYKKKFYRDFIDPDFDINYIPSGGENEESAFSPPPEVIENNLRKQMKEKYGKDNQNNKTNYERIKEKYELSKLNNKPIDNCVIKYSQIMFLIFFILSIPLGVKTIKLAIYAFLLKTIREVGMISFNKKYFQSLLLNDSFHTLIYLFICNFDYFNYYMILPVSISALVSIAEDLKDIKLPINFYQNYILSINKVKENLIQDKTHLEVAIGFMQIIGGSIGINKFSTPILYWHILRFRYSVNPYANKSFSELNNLIDIFKESNKCPNFLKYLLEKVQKFFYYLGNMNNQNQSQE